MVRRVFVMVLSGLIVAFGASAFAADEENEKKVINGPSKTSFGALQLILGQGASAETAFQPDASRIVVKTLVGEARIVTSARQLILVENMGGRVDILLPNGRVVVVEPGKSEIVGRALTEDPGNITVRLSGTGPIAQSGGPPVTDGLQTEASVTVLTPTPQGALIIQDTQNGPFVGGPQPVSPSQ